MAYRDDIHCPDGGRCSHPTSCDPEGSCWRVLHVAPLSHYGPQWPPEVTRDPKPVLGRAG